MPPAPSLLCNANFPANTGFAWDYIEGIYAQVADRLAARGFRTFVAYPSIPAPPKPLQGSAAIPIELSPEIGSPSAVAALAGFVRRENVQVLYFTDREPIHWAYAVLRAAGVKRVVVHDHASGERVAPQGLKRAIKWVAGRLAPVAADTVVAVSDFVARRQIEVGLMPPERVVRIYNSVGATRRPSSGNPDGLRELAGFPDGPVIACACRSTPEKGVQHLMRAFDLLLGRGNFPGPEPVLVYLGDGPALGALRELRESLPSRSSIVLAGYRPDAAALLAGAELCVVPSTWQEAFGLAVVEPMALGKPVIASRVGAIPELIRDGVTGLLVAPGDAGALAEALARMLAEPELAREMGEAARRWVETELTLERKLRQLLPLLEQGFEQESPAARLFAAGRAAPTSRAG